MRQWEYCVVTRLGARRGGWVQSESNDTRCYKLTPDGVETIIDLDAIIRQRPKGKKDWDTAAQIIAQLGMEGWEMTGVCDYGG